jgi:hypothetical protein
MVNSFVEGTVEIAQGSIKKAADFLEGSLSRGIPIILGFLANQVGLRLADKIADALKFVREKVDKGLDWLIDKLVGFVEKLIAAGKAAVNKLIGWWKARNEIQLPKGEKHTLYFEGNNANAVLTMRSVPMPYRAFVNTFLSSLPDEAARKAKEPAVKAALAKFTEIEKEKKKSFESLPEAQRKVEEQKQADTVEKLVGELADLSKELFNDGTPGGAGLEGFLSVPANMSAVKSGDPLKMRKLLEEGKVWRDAIMLLQQKAPQKPDYTDVVTKMQEYRQKIVDSLKKKPYNMSISGKKPSKEPVSDIDMITTGKDAGAKLISAQQFMRAAHGANWTPMLRMNFYTDSKRLTAYETIKEKLGDRFPRFQAAVTARTELLTYAKMLQHARGDAERTQQVHDMMADVAANIRPLAEEWARETPAEGSLRVRDLHLAIDELMAEKREPATTEERKLEIAERITLFQMEANFRTEEAYISPGAGRQVVRLVAVKGHEAYQSALGQLEMLEHDIHQAKGLENAIQEYELYKYVSRFISATQAAGAPLTATYMMFYEEAHQIYSDKTKRTSMQNLERFRLARAVTLYGQFQVAARDTLAVLKGMAEADATLWKSRALTLAVDIKGTQFMMLATEKAIKTNRARLKEK